MSRKRAENQRLRVCNQPNISIADTEIGFTSIAVNDITTKSSIETLWPYLSVFGLDFKENIVVNLNGKVISFCLCEKQDVGIQ